MNDFTSTPVAEPEKPKLKSANENPWYLLATLHGELVGEHPSEVNIRQIQERNRRSWNRFWATLLPEEDVGKVKKLIDINGHRLLNDDDLKKYTDKEWSDILNKIKNNDILLNNNYINFRCNIFENYIYFSGYWFPLFLDFSFTKFQRNSEFIGSIFSKGVNFDSVEFDVHIGFSRSIFSENATFLGTKFSRSTSLMKRIFLDSLILTIQFSAVSHYFREYIS